MKIQDKLRIVLLLVSLCLIICLVLDIIFFEFIRRDMMLSIRDYFVLIVCFTMVGLTALTNSIIYALD